MSLTLLPIWTSCNTSHSLNALLPMVSTLFPITTLATLLLLNSALSPTDVTLNVSPSISTVFGIFKFTGLFNENENSTFFVLPSFSVTV